MPVHRRSIILIARLPAALTGATVLICATILYKIQRHVWPRFFKGYKQLSRAEARDWDSRIGTMIYST